MKPVVFISLCMNGVLILLLIFTTPKGRSEPVLSMPSEKRIVITSDTKPAGAKPVIKPSPFSDGDLPWQRVQSLDYKVYIENLRAVGCPEKTIRDIIKADIQKNFAAREKAVRDRNWIPYWKPKSRTPVDLLVYEEIREIQKAKQETLKNLLGTDVETAETFQDIQNRFSEFDMDFLPSEKTDAISEIIKKHQRRIIAWQTEAGGIFDAEDLEQFSRIQRENQHEIAAILTPHEWEQYALRNSPTAQFLREISAEMSLSEEEFIQLFRIRKPFDEQYADLGPPRDLETIQKQMKIQAALEEELKKALGPERFAQHQRAMDRRLTKMTK